MALTLRQKRELLATVGRVRRDLAEVLGGLEAIKADYDDLGPDVATYLAAFFTPQQWLTTRNTVDSWLTRLDNAFVAQEGDGLDKLRPPAEIVTGKFSDAGF